MIRVVFYTKLKCHLCEEAYQMLLELTSDIPMQIDMIDIAQGHNQDLLASYGQRIPVLAKPGAEAELNWPFTPDQIKAYLQA